MLQDQERLAGALNRTLTVQPGPACLTGSQSGFQHASTLTRQRWPTPLLGQAKPLHQGTRSSYHALAPRGVFAPTTDKVLLSSAFGKYYPFIAVNHLEKNTYEN